MPHCLSALDGKHIRIRKPSNSGSLWYDYKGFFSMVLLAVCDARYCFTLVDFGEYGSNNGCEILRNPRMGRRYGNGEMSILESEKILEDDLELPYFLVGGEIFPLQTWLMRPFSGKALINEIHKIFNYRLSGTRRIIENTFTILVAQWRIFQKPIELRAENVEKLVLLAIVLHNHLK